MVVKEDIPPEDSHIVWNGTNKLKPKDIMMNDVVSLYNEAPITFVFFPSSGFCDIPVQYPRFIPKCKH